MAEAIPRTPLILLLALIAILGAVEATPKEVALSVSTDPLSASPLNSLPAGASAFAEDLARAGYDVRIYADLTDLAFDAPDRVLVVIVGPERVTTTQARFLAEYATAARYTAVLLADERPRETGSLAIIERAQAFCPTLTSNPRPVFAGNATPALLSYAVGGGSYAVSLTALPTTSIVRGLVPPSRGAPPVPPLPAPGGYEILAFAAGSDGAWYPMAFACRSETTGIGFVGDSDFARNYLYTASEEYRLFALTLVEKLAGPPGDGVVVAFIVSFYVGEELSLATVIHPSYLLSLLAQLYASTEKELLEALGARTPLLLAAATAVAAFIAAGHMARPGRGPKPREASPRGREAREAALKLCSYLKSRDSRVERLCRRMYRPHWRALYALLGWRRVYTALLARAGGGDGKSWRE